MATSRKLEGSVEESNGEEDIFSGGSTFCCNSLRNLDVLRCNNSINKKLDSEVSWVVWDTISKLGISSNMRQEGNVDDIENMERRRGEGKQNLEVNLKSML